MFTALRPFAFIPARPASSSTRMLLGAWAFIVIAACLPAQGRIWIVDASNGPGTDFKDLPQAIAAAADGDQIRVRAGSYSAATTGKALTILGGPGVSFASFSPTLEVSGLPAGRDFVLEGFDDASIVKPQVRVRNCAGRVLLDRLRLWPFPGQLNGGPGISIESSALVTVQASLVTASPAVLANGSTVRVTDTELHGSDAALTFTLQPSFAALDITGGSLELTNSNLHGGNGWSAAQTAAPSPALLASNAALRIAAGSAWGTLVAGTGTPLPAPALRGTLGSLRIDPSVVLTPYNSAAIVGTIAVQTLRLPALQALGAPPGGTVHVDLFAPAGNLAALFVSPPANPVSMPVFGGDLGIDPLRALHAITATIGASGHLTLDIPVRNDASLRGANWVWQGIAGTVQGGFLLSNCASYAQN